MAFNPRFRRKKICKFCERKIDEIDYKKADILKRYTSEKGKIFSRRMTGTCAFHQRQLTAAIKRARMVALLPFVDNK